MIKKTWDYFIFYVWYRWRPHTLIKVTLTKKVDKANRQIRWGVNGILDPKLFSPRYASHRDASIKAVEELLSMLRRGKPKHVIK